MVQAPQTTPTSAHYAWLLALIAIILFVLAALGGFDVLIHTSVKNVLGLMAVGLAVTTASRLVP